MNPLLSERGAAGVATLDLPWRFAPKQTHDPVDNPDGLISFATAENALVTKDLEAFVQNNVQIQAADFLYKTSTAGGQDFPKALAKHLKECLQPWEPIETAHIQVTASATAMHDILAWAVAEPGHGILTSRPVYGRFELDFGNKSRVKVVYADTDPVTCFEEDIVDRFEEALERAKAEGVAVRAVLIVNPNNPLGKCYPKETLINIMRFCQEHKLHLISDEIYACSVFDSGEPSAVPFTSVFSINTSPLIDPDLLHLTYGLSKDFGAAGLRVGAIVTRSQPIHRAVQAAMRFHNPSGPSLAIGTAMLADRAWCGSFLRESRQRLAAAYGHVTSGLRAMGVEYVRGANAGFFVYVDLSPWLAGAVDEDGDREEGWYKGEENAEFGLARRVLDAGLFLHPREEHAQAKGWFRLVYTQDARTVTEGLRRLMNALDQTGLKSGRSGVSGVTGEA